MSDWTRLDRGILASGTRPMQMRHDRSLILRELTQISTEVWVTDFA